MLFPKVIKELSASNFPYNLYAGVKIQNNVCLCIIPLVFCRYEARAAVASRRIAYNGAGFILPDGKR